MKWNDRCSTDYDRLCKSVNPWNSHAGLAPEASNIPNGIQVLNWGLIRSLHFGCSRWSLAPGRVYLDDVTVFQIASFSPSTLENSVFKKYRFQIASLLRAFSNGSVFGDRFRRCRVDDSRIRSKTAPFSFEKGLVRTRPWFCFWVDYDLRLAG